jgi:deoxyribodipyrimidine photolyase-related protein
MSDEKEQSMKNTGLLFPHQLFEENSLLGSCDEIYLIEEALFFTQYSFHKQKLVFHRASMKQYAEFLSKKKKRVHYIDSCDELSDVRSLISHLKKKSVAVIEYIDPTDDWLSRRLSGSCKKAGIKTICHPSPLFITTPEENNAFFKGRTRMFQTDYYIHQRKSRKILMEKDGKPTGGQWSFDEMNRNKFPKNEKSPRLPSCKPSAAYKSAVLYVEESFPDNYGDKEGPIIYPTSFREAKKWLHDFLTDRFEKFGEYEDAMVAAETVLHHSVLTPMLNVGLITPDYVLAACLEYATNHKVPINSTEGFVRQVVGWREFIRAVYERKGREERTRNYWGFTRSIPKSFWTAQTGIIPFDNTLRKVLATGYCHHIERLMVLGNFMLLCEFDPDEVYRWFMTLFIDAYDWVMVPNVYGMSQFADGGLMATKPYISGSNYLMKMSDFPKGDWQQTWDALFWRFMHVHRDFFMQNPRLGMLIKTFDKMPDERRRLHLEHAELFLKTLNING